MRIIARVLPIARIRNMEQPAVVQVSEADVARGYLEIRQGSRFMLQANAPYSVTFTRTATWIESATVRGLGSDVVVGMEGGTYQRPRPTTTRVDSVLDYRFRLATDTLPGTYDWPLVMTLNVSP